MSIFKLALTAFFVLFSHVGLATNIVDWSQLIRDTSPTIEELKFANSDDMAFFAMLLIRS